MKSYMSGPGTLHHQKQWRKFREPGIPYYKRSWRYVSETRNAASTAIVVTPRTSRFQRFTRDNIWAPVSYRIFVFFVFFVCPLGGLSILHLLVMNADSDISWTTFWAAVCVLFIVYIWMTMFVHRRLYKLTASALVKEKGESKLQRKVAEDALQKAHEAKEEFKARDANVSTLQADLEEIKRTLKMEIALRGMAEENLRADQAAAAKQKRKLYRRDPDRGKTI
jgi:hypothetical protein